MNNNPNYDTSFVHFILAAAGRRVDLHCSPTRQMPDERPSVQVPVPFTSLFNECLFHITLIIHINPVSLALDRAYRLYTLLNGNLEVAVTKNNIIVTCRNSTIGCSFKMQVKSGMNMQQELWKIILSGFVGICLLNVIKPTKQEDRIMLLLINREKAALSRYNNTCR